MKKKLMGIVTIIAIAAGAGYNVYASRSNVKLSDLALANVEALARDEGNSDLYIRSSNGCYYEFSGPKNSEITVSVGGVTLTLKTDRTGKAYYYSASGEVHCAAGGNELCTPQNCSAGPSK